MAALLSRGSTAYITLRLHSVTLLHVAPASGSLRGRSVPVMAPSRQFPSSTWDVSVLAPVSVMILCVIGFLMTTIACACCKKDQISGKKKQPESIKKSSVVAGGVGDRYQQVTIAFATNMLGASTMAILKGARAPSCVFSPYALQAAFAICMMGSDGLTQTELASTLFPNSGTVDYAEDVLKEMINTTKKCRDSGFFKVFLRVYAHSGFPYSNGFKESVKTYFPDQPFVPIDYRKAHGDDMAKTTHQWLAKATRNRLTRFESASWHPVNETKSSLCVVSAATLNCQWTHPFYQHHTHEHRPFFIKVGKSIKMQMMKQLNMFGFYSNEQVQVLRLEYQNSDMAAYLFLPRVMGGMERLEAKMTPDFVLAMCRSAVQRQLMVEVTLPKFKMECEIGDSMVVALANLGLATSFKHGEASFSPMLDIKSKSPKSAKVLKTHWISGAVHKALIEFTDTPAQRQSQNEGSEASLKSLSVSNMTGTGSSAPSVGSARGGVEMFLADHPFLFLIVVEPNMTPLFYGRFCGV